MWTNVVKILPKVLTKVPVINKFGTCDIFSPHEGQTTPKCLGGLFEPGA